jgi:hypothetical protein
MGLVTAAIAGAVTSVVGGAVQANQAKKAAGRAGRQKSAAEAKVQELVDSRQQIINPYESTESLAGLAKDLSSQMTNPFANLGVATQAAEMQAEEADIALANTLDTIRETGASAGGATALAMAALQSKKGVAANIEQQEAQNEKLRAQGEQALQAAKISEQQRLQTIAISEGQRVQAAEAAGKQFEYQAQERRTEADLDRASGQVSQASAQQAQARQAQAQAWGSAISGVGNIAGSYMGAVGN